jgi:ribose 5-phosphate isomerase A
MSKEAMSNYHFETILPLDEVVQRLARKDVSHYGEQNLLKMRVGWEIANKVKDGSTIALGSGSTSEAAIRAIGERFKPGDNQLTRVSAIATSRSLGHLAGALGMQIEDFDQTMTRAQDSLRKTPPQDIEWGFDGADEVEIVNSPDNSIASFRIVKGGGGAHTIERAVANRCKSWIVIVDESKIVPELGKFPFPLEVTEKETDNVATQMMVKYGASNVTFKTNKGGSHFRTDMGNFVLNAEFGQGRIDSRWETEFRQIPGVVDTGLFIATQPSEILVCHKDGSIESLRPETQVFP